MVRKFNDSKISIVITKAPDKNWNSLISKSEFGTYFQTMEYAKARKKFFGHIPMFLRFYSTSGKVIGQLLLFQTRFALERFKKYFGFSKISSIYKNFAFPINNLNWSYGPLIFDMNYKNDIMQSFANFLKSEKYNFKGHSHPLDGLVFPSQFGFNTEKNSTFVINLNDDIETIFNNTNKNSVRKNIKRSEIRGVKIRLIESKSDALNHFNLLKEHRIRNNLIYPSKEIVLENYRLGKKKGLTGFLALFEGKPIASITFVYLNGYILEEGISRSVTDIRKKLYAQELLRWNIIKWGKENDCKFYDLAGVKAENRTTKEDGIFRNKEKWGGKLIHYKSYSKK